MITREQRLRELQLEIYAWECENLEAWERHFSEELAAILAEDVVVNDDVPFVWLDGYPTKFWAEEWFIAHTIYGDRVVLKALPEEYSYDFTTADGTYMKKENVKRWAQFPDSQYKAAALNLKEPGQ